MDKAAVFIDSGALSVLTKHVFTDKDGSPIRLDMLEFGKMLCDECDAKLLRVYYYTCPPHQSQYPTAEEQQRKSGYDKFTYSLRQLKQFQLREGKLRKYFDEYGKPDFVQKGVDVLLAIDMLRLALKGAIQKVVLVASDSDFVPVIRALRDEGVFVTLFFYRSDDKGKMCYSHDLSQECDDRIEFREDHFLKNIIK